MGINAQQNSIVIGMQRRTHTMTRSGRHSAEGTPSGCLCRMLFRTNDGAGRGVRGVRVH